MMSLMTRPSAAVDSVPRADSLVPLFAALADPTRLRLLNLIAGRELCVCYLVETLRQSQPKISRHLAYLRKAGVVAARREGKWMHYRLVRPRDPVTASILATVLDSIRRDPKLQADRDRLTRACCQPDRFVTLLRAPQPTVL
jgi:ArsR family transcriptional regulator